MPGQNDKAVKALLETLMSPIPKAAINAAENASVAVRGEDAFDVDAVDRVLKDALPGLSGAPRVSQFPSGASNLTYAVDYPGRRLVLRRPPMGAKPKSGHSMIREYTVMSALKPVYQAVPACVYYASTEDSVIGAEFYVMDRVDGALVKDTLPAEWGWDAARTRQFCQTVWDKLIALHGVDYSAIGLGTFGKPEGYVERQIVGWNGRYEAALTDDADPGEDVRDWLDANRPARESGASIVHGDFRIDNMILGDTEPHEIRAVLDWEISALGDPLMDLGASLVYWVEADDPPGLKALKKQPSDAPGMFTRKDVVAYYGEKTGQTISDFSFYYAYGIFRLAVIAQQIYYRYYHKQTTNPAYAPFGPGAKGLVAAARRVIAEGW